MESAVAIPSGKSLCGFFTCQDNTMLKVSVHVPQEKKVV